MAIWLLCLAALALLPRSVVGGRSGKDVGVITESGLVDVALNESNRSYSEGDPIGLEVEYIAGNRSIVKYDLYYSKFGFCRPDPIKYHGDGILHGMMGIERADTGLEVPFLKDLRCVEWCGDDIIPNEDISFINESINNDYYMRMYLGGVRVKAMLSPNSPLCAYDVPIGKKVGSSGLWTVPAYHNYYSFEVYCHKEDSGRYTIRDVVVRPESRRFRTAADCKDDNFNTDITSLNKEWGGRPAIFHSVKFVLDRDPACKVSSEHDSSDISYLKSYIGGLVLPTLVVVAANIITWSKKNNNAGEDHSYKELSKGDKDVVLTDLGLSYQDLSTIPQSVTLVSIMVAEGVHNLSMIMAAATMGLFGYFTTDNLPRIIVDSIAMYIILSFLRGFVSFGIYKFFLSATWVAPTPGLALLQPFLVLLYVFATREIIMRRGAPSYSNLDILLSLLVLYILLTVLTFAGSMNSGLLTSGSSPPETTDTNDDIHSKGSSCWLWNLKLTAAFMHFISFYNLLVFSTNFLWSGKIILSPIALLTAASFFVVSSSIFSAVICLKHLKKGYYKWHSVHGTYYPIIFLFCLQYALYFFIFELGSKDVASVVVYTLVSSAMAHIASSMSYAIGFLSSLAVVVPRKKAMSATPQV